MDEGGEREGGREREREGEGEREREREGEREREHYIPEDVSMATLWPPSFSL